jgi:hypothetical protein
MKSSAISSIQHLRIAKEYMDDFVRANKKSIGGGIFNDYIRRIDWILKDIITYPYFSEQTREALREEYSSDPLTTSALFEKIPLLSPEQKEVIEILVDGYLNGEQINFEK